jgi:hypothetical protein
MTGDRFWRNKRTFRKGFLARLGILKKDKGLPSLHVGPTPVDKSDFGRSREDGVLPETHGDEAESGAG